MGSGANIERNYAAPPPTAGQSAAEYAEALPIMYQAAQQYQQYCF